MIRAIVFFVFLFLSCFALAGSPSLSAPATSSNGSVTLTPNQPESPYFLTEYWRMAPGGSWTQIGVYYGSYPYTDTVSSNGLYAYRSRWFNPSAPSGSQYSYWSNTVYVDVYVTGIPSSVPSLSAPTSDADGTFNVSWSTSAGASSYQLQRRVNSGSWSTIQNNSNTSFTNNNLAAGIYDFRVRACNSAGCTSYSTVKTTNVTNTGVPATPASITFMPSNGSNVVYWSSVSGATYYIMQHSSGGSWSTYYNGGGTGTTVGSRTPPFRVQACNSNGCSGWRYVYY